MVVAQAVGEHAQFLGQVQHMVFVFPSSLLAVATADFFSSVLCTAQRRILYFQISGAQSVRARREWPCDGPARALKAMAIGAERANAILRRVANGEE